MANTVVRYSDAELEEFKALIESKLERAQTQLNSLQEQILEIAENSSDDHGVDWMDDSSTGSDVEMLNNMAIRQRRYIQDLQNALIRIRNKVYGVCIITGELIDKKRLRAVPTTTKSLAAKIQPPVSTRSLNKAEEEEDEDQPKPKAPKPAKNKVITRVIRKSPTTKPIKPVDLDNDDDDDYKADDLYGDDIDDIDDDNMISLEGLQEDEDTDIDEQDLRLREEDED